MSKPREIWWGYVKAIIRRYPELCEREAALHRQCISPALTGMPHGGKTTNPTADAALRELPEKQQREVAAVRAAIVKTQALQDGAERMEMVRLVFWDRTHTLDGVALSLPTRGAWIEINKIRRQDMAIPRRSPRGERG